MLPGARAAGMGWGKRANRWFAEAVRIYYPIDSTGYVCSGYSVTFLSNPAITVGKEIAWYPLECSCASREFCDVTDQLFGVSVLSKQWFYLLISCILIMSSGVLSLKWRFYGAAI